MSDKIREAFDAWISSVDKRRDANGWEPLTARDVHMLREGYMEAALAQQPAPAAPVAVQEPVAEILVDSRGMIVDAVRMPSDLPPGFHKVYTAPPAAEQQDTVKVLREQLEEWADAFDALEHDDYASECRALLAGGDA